MKLQMIGCSHHDAAVEFREQISFTTDQQVSDALGAFRERFPSGELVLLSTCNRVELYAAAGDDEDSSIARRSPNSWPSNIICRPTKSSTR